MKEELKRRVDNYLKKAKPLFENLEISECDLVFDDQKLKEIKKHFHEMALSYYNDSKYFRDKGDYINALSALEYAEGWLDAGISLGILKIRNKNHER
ncbi:MAG: DUF357 domain-containing protein [Candidatus Altiarchaeales archaeon]|nr:MAG: DUF357 domain-containing protein [Candidatus Altiarchaeales archaeon]